jgi:hypothetical protein
VIPVFKQAGGNREPIQLGNMDIDKDQLELTAHGLLKARFPIETALTSAARPNQIKLENPLVAGVVLDHQNIWLVFALFLHRFNTTKETKVSFLIWAVLEPLFSA